MEWLQYFKVGELSLANYAFIIWFIGLVGGYCVGRAHAAWIILRKHYKV